MFKFVKKCLLYLLLSFSGSLSSMTNVSNFTRCLSLNNQPCMTRLILIDLNPD